MSYSLKDRQYLYSLLLEKYDFTELIILTNIELGLDHEIFTQTNKLAFTSELLSYLERHGRVQKLVDILLSHHKDTQLEKLLAKMENQSIQFDYRLFETASVRILHQHQDDITYHNSHPYPPIQFRGQVHQFVGREELLESVKRYLDAGDVVSLYGSPGVGKTAIASKVAQELYFAKPCHFPDGVIWSDFETAYSVESILQQILGAYRFDSLHTDIWTGTQNLLLKKRALWVIDGINRMSQGREVAALLAVRGSCKVLITSRVSELVDGFKLEVGVLPPKDSLTLFQALSGRGIEDEEPEAEIICAKLGCLPLAVRIFASTVGSRAGRYKSLSRFLQRLKVSKRLDILKSLIPTMKLKDQEVRASFELSWQDLGDDKTREVFASIGVFSGQDWDIYALAAILNYSTNEIENIIDILVNRCLLEQGRAEDRYSAHPLLREYAREKLGSETSLLWKLADYYSFYVSSIAEHLNNSEAMNAREYIYLELDNIRGVWKFCLTQVNKHGLEVVRSLLTYLWAFLLEWGFDEDVTELIDCASELAKHFDDKHLMAEVCHAHATLAMTKKTLEMQ